MLVKKRIGIRRVFLNAFSQLHFLFLPLFLFKWLQVSNEKFPSCYFKYHRKSDFDSSCLQECDARRGLRRKAEALCPRGGVQSG